MKTTFEFPDDINKLNQIYQAPSAERTPIIENKESVDNTSIINIIKSSKEDFNNRDF